MDVKNKIIVDLQKQICEYRTRNIKLQENNDFLKSIIALALKDVGYIVVHEQEIETQPKFILDENIEGEMIIRRR